MNLSNLGQTLVFLFHIDRNNGGLDDPPIITSQSATHSIRELGNIHDHIRAGPPGRTILKKAKHCQALLPLLHREQIYTIHHRQLSHSTMISRTFEWWHSVKVGNQVHIQIFDKRRYKYSIVFEFRNGGAAGAGANVMKTSGYY